LKNTDFNINRFIENFNNASIAVIGDICLDLYYFIRDDISEISLETGLETRSVASFKFEGGGACNVSINLKTLGAGNVDLYGIMGNDKFGHILTGILKENAVNTENIVIQNTDWDTNVFHKVYSGNKEEPRCDVGNQNFLHEYNGDKLLDNLRKNIDSYDAVIINEQVLSGYHQNKQFRKKLADFIAANNKKCLWYTDCRHFNGYYNGTIRKLNNKEARAFYTAHNKEKKDNISDIEIAEWLSCYWKNTVVVTMGQDGAAAADCSGKIIEVPGINVIGRVDTVGAGDAFLSAFVLSLVSGSSLKEALLMGNLSAAVSVTKIFETGHPQISEILELSENPDFRFNPLLASDIRRAEYIPDTPVEIIKSEKPRKKSVPKVVIFDHDGTISTLREGWEPVMENVAVRSILGDSYRAVSPEKLLSVKSAVAEMIEKTTGIQTITQMFYLRDMVREWGFVPEEKILSPAEYKNQYNNELMKLVNGRSGLFKKGLLDLNDLTIKGSVGFLERLRNAGVLLFLASGTDQDDVRKEAGLLGYSEYFNGGIYGSTGDPSSDPKKVVLEKIIRELPDNISSGNCYVFGDGPVEMREAVKTGFTSVGVISDEKKRYGPDYRKRSRLILAGADYLIPDFSWSQILIDYLKWDI